MKTWLSVLQASNIVRIIEPFWPNIGKSLTKTPKLYFMDTGLVCHLTRWTTPEQLQVGAVAGHVFETFVVSEVLKSYMNAGGNVRDVWFYRDAKKRMFSIPSRSIHRPQSELTPSSTSVASRVCRGTKWGMDMSFARPLSHTP